ncbi:putative metabolite transport protein [Neolecta irregularis DAH-3]|uniref:Putative metabolite transport protein n=1 Tax=Neolecta irregularis (strain DAH-3) TaxID=1198029 RepID=A0A1U7LT42_NEOID|nr:putative metabolite transport protein [Neolecta irregularis DAH-3]|eukprot:OLL25840.1 putative metabolite transport protein [Neolecta irregularis DAH-3]
MIYNDPQGFGVGGEYPASSTSASEAANEQLQKSRGPIFIMVTKSVPCSTLHLSSSLPLSFGGPVSMCIFLIVYSAAGSSHLTTVWRVCFGLGAVLPLSVFYFRLRLVTSKLYREGAIKKRVPYWLVLKYYWRSLIGTCLAWFIYDFVTFPNGIFSGAIISSLVKNSSIKKTAEYQLLLNTLQLPGIFIGALLCNPLGRKNTMMLGFSGYLIFGLVIGLSYDRITKMLPLFVIFYGLMQSSGNLGPGDFLGLLSSESYATPIRGTCYGLSAAVGKAGAAIGTQVFQPIQIHWGKRWTFIVAAVCGIVGILVTWIFVPDLTGEDLALEDRRFEEFLRKEGWTGDIGDDQPE